jgi:hypothetical protein
MISVRKAVVFFSQMGRAPFCTYSNTAQSPNISAKADKCESGNTRLPPQTIGFANYYVVLP